MYRLSLIISEIYNKYLPLAEKDGIILNLDFSDTTKQISDPDRVKKDLENHLSSALQRSDQGEVTISVDKAAISVTDTGTTLSPSVCALLSNRFIDVSSRVGFGTTVKIFLQPRDLPATPTIPKPKLELEGAAAAVALDNTTTEPTLQTEAKVATKRGKSRRTLGARLQLKGKKAAIKNAKSASVKSTKAQTKKVTTKTSRQLTAAAKKADKEVKRIAKKANKASKVTQKSQKKSAKATKSTKTTTKSSKPRKVKKLSLS